ncbi:MAG TPA: hypothetical protein PKM57_03450 [Kiritimatiellia bacterium]|nr:hypothetical protein [Kiritimatiellia bacterium]
MHSIQITLPFNHSGTVYFSQITSESGVVHVQALTADHEPCGFEYTITLPQDYYLDALLELEVVKALIEQAKLDVTEGRWATSISELEKAVVAKWIHHSDDWQSHPGFIVHTDVFDRPITEARYMEFLERTNFHGFPIEGYGVGPVHPADDTGKVWTYLHSRSCD